MKKLLLILICLFIYSCDEPEKKTKSELDIKEEEFREKFKLESEKLVKLLQLDLEQFVNVEKINFHPGTLFSTVWTGMTMCSPRLLESYKKLDSEKILNELGEKNNLFKFQEKKCSITKDLYEVVKPSFDEIIRTKSIPENLYYFTYINRGGESELNDIGLFLNLEDCEKYNQFYLTDLKFQTLECKNYSDIK